jgi:hypothetical protein
MPDPDRHVRRSAGGNDDVDLAEARMADGVLGADMDRG